MSPEKPERSKEAALIGSILSGEELLFRAISTFLGAGDLYEINFENKDSFPWSSGLAFVLTSRGFHHHKGPMPGLGCG